MDTASFCDLCSVGNKSLSSTKYCPDCEERLCTDCAESHDHFKAFKSHHVIDLSSVSSNIPISAKKICNVHPDLLLDFYCTDYDIFCCRACIPCNHRECKNVLPLEHASKDVKKSALCTDVMQNIKYLVTTLNDCNDNKNSNLQLIVITKSVITLQITQIIAETSKRFVGLEKGTELKLKTGVKYDLRNLSITKDNILLLIDDSQSSQTLYVYRDCKYYETKIKFASSPYRADVISGTQRAVVNLPTELSIQFINTTNMTKGDKIKVGFVCYEITSNCDILYVGGQSGIIKIFDINGKIKKTIKQGAQYIYQMLYDDVQKQLIAQCPNTILCVKVDGTLVYSKDAPGVTGVTFDQDCNIYFDYFNNSKIQRMSSDAKTCEEMINRDDGIIQPHGICFNNDFTKLFVINNEGTSVFVYQFSKPLLVEHMHSFDEAHVRLSHLTMKDTQIEEMKNTDMATASFYDPCSEVNKSLTATKYCSTCEEILCTDCAESHDRFNAFKYHHVINLSSVGTNIQIFSFRRTTVKFIRKCSWITTAQIMRQFVFRACIPCNYGACENVLLLEYASNDVKKSALFPKVLNKLRIW
ncbi:unnamed protein product [Mytilus coruscus]|uniref:B box-type domain-containing protein n=1 Tax=Mytilus coruscus TaxID=42192 RepID=A0A6J8AL80_MYTCO|nr:unnamed protein product [Mytilus coruscus]